MYLEPRFQRGTRFRALRGRILGAWSSSQYQQRLFLLRTRRELSHLNDGIAQHCNGARLAFHTVHCGLEGSKPRKV